jgi:large subunit ribosomal protein L17
MRHHNANRKLGRERNQRRALLKTLAFSLIMKEKIETTEPKAKELRPFVERLISYGKAGTVAKHRMLAGVVGNRGAKKVSTTLAERYKDRKGGYIRILRLAHRGKDGSKRSIIEFV